jgi:hypothetical protein
MNLVTLATEESWQEFDDAWAKLMATDEPLDELYEALGVVGQKRRMARVMAIVRDHVDVLTASQRHAEAAELVGAAMVAGGAPGELAASLFQQARSAWGEESW